MKKLNKVAMLIATAALATAAGAQSVDNWVSGSGIAVKNGTNELCWRDANWTPATAAKGCDGAIVAAPRLLLLLRLLLPLPLPRLLPRPPLPAR